VGVFLQACANALIPPHKIIRARLHLSPAVTDLCRLVVILTSHNSKMRVKWQLMHSHRLKPSLRCLTCRFKLRATLSHISTHCAIKSLVSGLVRYHTWGIVSFSWTRTISIFNQLPFAVRNGVFNGVLPLKHIYFGRKLDFDSSASKICRIQPELAS